MTQKLRVKCLNRKSTYYEDDYYESVPRFRAVRIILGIISLAGFGFFTYKGFMTGLNGTTDGGGTSGTLYIILALCMLVSSLLYFIMQKSNTIFAFLLPMLFYLGSGVFAFLKRGDDLQLLIAAIVSGVLAIYFHSYLRSLPAEDLIMMIVKKIMMKPLKTIMPRKNLTIRKP